MSESDQSSNQCATEYRISLLHILAAAALFLVSWVLSTYLSLGLNRRLIIAGVRCFAQLAILGHILHPIFTHPTWVPILLVIMLLVAAVEVMSRPSYSYSEGNECSTRRIQLHLSCKAVILYVCLLKAVKGFIEAEIVPGGYLIQTLEASEILLQGMFLHILLGVGGSTFLVMLFAMFCVIPWYKAAETPFYEPSYLIPLVGLLLGNTLSGVSLGLTTVLEELAAGRERVEVLLSMGANRFEATKGVIQRSLHVALIPMINQMSVVGIVSIPGMMTGQMLAGADPVQAAYYQMAVLFLIGTTTALGSIITVLMAVFTAVDADQRLRGDRLHLRNRAAGIEVWVIAHLMKITERIKQFSKRMYVAGRGGIRRSWYNEAPVTRPWGYYPINGEDEDGELVDTSLGPVIIGSDMGSDEVFSTNGVPGQVGRDSEVNNMSNGFRTDASAPVDGHLGK